MHADEATRNANNSCNGHSASSMTCGTEHTTQATSTACNACHTDGIVQSNPCSKWEPVYYCAQHRHALSKLTRYAKCTGVTVQDKEIQAGLTLNEVVCVIDNVCAEEYGSQQREDGVLNWSWREEHLEQAPDQKRHEAAEKHWAQEAANTEIVSAT